MLRCTSCMVRYGNCCLLFFLLVFCKHDQRGGKLTSHYKETTKYVGKPFKISRKQTELLSLVFINLKKNSIFYLKFSVAFVLERWSSCFQVTNPAAWPVFFWKKLNFIHINIKIFPVDTMVSNEVAVTL